jgi:flavin reductase (DIM6/NTAB) family NADH-FMN oxidoreductase RutF
MTANSASLDPRAFRTACGTFATGVTVVSTRTDQGDHGMTANAFMSVSLEPPLVVVSIDKKARILDKLRQAGRYAINVLTEDMQDAALHFAGRAHPGPAPVFTSRDGLPLLPGCAAHFLTDVGQEIEAGDHVLFIGQVSEFQADPSLPPLLFSGGQFRHLPPLPRAAAE